MSLNVTEYGIALKLNVNYDLSGAESLLLSFIRPDLTTFEGVPTAPSEPVTSPDIGVFPANRYARYVFQPGDLNQPGEYFVRLVYTDPAKRLLSEVTSFEVRA